MTYRTVNTSELRPGDVVQIHGMRCLIDREIETYNRLDRNGDDVIVYWVQALVLNRDEVPNRIVPVSWTADWRREGTAAWNDEHRWTIQGNKLARWAVEEVSV